MTVGILTYHFSINFGAVLQCYALQEALRNMGLNVYIINFISDEQKDNISLYRRFVSNKSIIKNIILLPFHFQRSGRNSKFRKFIKEYLHVTKEIHDKEGLKEVIKELNIDCIFVGSDQVWNPLIKDFNDVFFLGGIGGIKKVGFAISLGVAKESDIEQYKNEIVDFDYVSVRERSAVKILNKLTGETPDIQIDPVFLLPDEKWISMSNGVKTHTDNRYILCYFLNWKHFVRNIKAAKDLADKNSMQLIWVSPRVSMASIIYKGKIDVGPIEFLKLIYGAEMVITDSFHGSVFSMVLKKPFYSIKYTKVSNDTRKEEVTRLLGLGELCIDSDELNGLDIPNPNFENYYKIENLRNEQYDRIRMIFNNISNSSSQNFNLY